MANDTKKYGKRYKIKGANAMRFTAHSPKSAPKVYIKGFKG